MPEPSLPSLRWTIRAAANLEAITDYIAADNPRAAAAFAAMVQKKALMLLDHPLMGRAGVLPLTRELVVHENYVLHYRVQAQGKTHTIALIRLLHVKRKFP